MKKMTVGYRSMNAAARLVSRALSRTVVAGLAAVLLTLPLAAQDLATDFGAAGLWCYKAGAWSKPTSWDPIQVVSWNSTLVVNFGSDRGLWAYDGSSWSKITTWSPYDMVLWQGGVACAFDKGRGFWSWGGSGWSKLSDWEPVALLGHGTGLAVTFGASKGLWLYQGGAWSKLSSWHPYDMVSSGARLFAAFDGGRGLWKREGGSWSQLSPNEPSHLAVIDSGLVGVFPGLGTYLHDGARWSSLTAWIPYGIVGWENQILAAFDAGRGFWRYASGTWKQLSTWKAQVIEPMVGRVAVDFGEAKGIYVYESASGWRRITGWTSDHMEATGVHRRGHERPAVPDIAYCEDVRDWPLQWALLEEEVLVIVNQRRAEGADCGSEGYFGPTSPLRMNAALRCATRKHSKDMGERDFFSHTNPDGQLPWARFGQAGYSYTYAGENIAAGHSTAAATMAQWMASDGHCANIMNVNFEDIGVGYHPDETRHHLWTQGFGRQP